jgi:hypothetical protein
MSDSWIHNHTALWMMSCIVLGFLLGELQYYWRRRNKP